MSIPVDSDVLEVASQFALAGRPVGVARQPGGHIHRSWVVTCAGARAGAGGVRYLLQALNTDVFPNPAAVMDNLARVTAHLRRAGEPTVTLVATGDGATWWRDPRGDAWRVFEFMEGAASRSPVTSPGDAFAVAQAFGRFAAALADLPPPPLAVTIPGFHDLRRRWAQLGAALSSPSGGGGGVAGGVLGKELAALQSNEFLISRWEDAVRRLPVRVAHNDAKPDNVLLDRGTGRLRAVIDLDTVMPGPILADLGDLVRGAACPAAEDETDLDRVFVDDELFEAIVAGYATGAAGVIGGSELAHVVLAAQCITFEQAARFLTDHLEGDRYYRIARPGHNLDRARTQLELLDDLVRREDTLRAIGRAAIRG